MGIDIRPRHAASSWIWGCLAARRGQLDGLGPADQPGVFLASLARTGVLRAEPLGDIIDIGTPAAFEAAQTSEVARDG